MSLRTPDLLFTAIAPAIWGSTYIVTTQYLPNFSPMTVAMLRALPAGLLLVMIVRQIPTGIWWMRIFILGALNSSSLANVDTQNLLRRFLDLRKPPQSVDTQ